MVNPIRAVRSAFASVVSFPRRLIEATGRVVRFALIAIAVVTTTVIVALLALGLTHDGSRSRNVGASQSFATSTPTKAVPSKPTDESAKKTKTVHVGPYTRKDGTKVREHTRTIPAK